MTQLPWNRRKRVLRFLLLPSANRTHTLIHKVSRSTNMKKSRQTFFFLFFYPLFSVRAWYMYELKRTKRKAKWKYLLISNISPSFDARPRLSVFSFFPLSPRRKVLFFLSVFVSKRFNFSQKRSPYEFSGERLALSSCFSHGIDSGIWNMTRLIKKDFSQNFSEEDEEGKSFSFH